MDVTHHRDGDVSIRLGVAELAALREMVVDSKDMAELHIAKILDGTARFLDESDLLALCYRVDEAERFLGKIRD